MTDNLPILYRNVMDGLPSDFARDVFLWAVERPGEGAMCYRAEDFAREADILVKRLVPLLDFATRILWQQKPHLFDGEPVGHDPDLARFFLKRHANWRYGGNVAPPYAAEFTADVCMKGQQSAAQAWGLAVSRPETPTRHSPRLPTVSPSRHRSMP